MKTRTCISLSVVILIFLLAACASPSTPKAPPPTSPSVQKSASSCNITTKDMEGLEMGTISVMAAKTWDIKVLLTSKNGKQPYLTGKDTASPAAIYLFMGDSMGGALPGGNYQVEIKSATDNKSLGIYDVKKGKNDLQVIVDCK